MTQALSTATPERFGGFPFGLSPAEEVRAAELHDRAVIIDMVHQGAAGHRLFDHPDLAGEKARLSRLFGHPLDFMAAAQSAALMLDQAGGTALRDLWRASGVTCGTMHIHVGGPGDAGDRLGRAAHLTATSLPWLTQARTAGDIRRAKATGSHCLVGYCQPVMPLPPDLSALDDAYERGLRVLMLTYNHADHVGAGCTASVDAGLTAFGQRVVDWCNSAGVVVDTSHCGPETTLQACRRSRQPVLANHTAAAALFPHPRGKSDDALRAIADTGGMVGIVTVPFFLSADPRADIGCLLDHIGHVADLTGIAHVGIGTDWPLTGPKAGMAANFGGAGLASIGFDEQTHAIEATRNLIGFDDYRDFPNITRGLVARGLDDDAILAVLGGNFLRVFGQVCGDDGGPHDQHP